MSIRGAQFSHSGRRRAICIFDQLGGRPLVAKPAVHGHVWLYIEQTAQRHEFVGADIVWLNCVPDGIHDRRTLVGIADGVAPLMSGNEVASGPTIYAGMQLLER